MNVDVQQIVEGARRAHEQARRDEAERLGITLEELEARKKREQRRANPERAKWLSRYDGLQPRGVLEDIYDGRLRHTVGIRAVERWLSSPDATPCLVLLGGTGSGKTVAALHAIRRLQSARFVRAPELGGAVRPTMDERRLGQEELDPRRVKLLVLDDLGAEQITPRFEQSLFLSVDARQDIRRRTIITSNLGKGDFRGRYDDRVIDRLNAIARVVALGGDSLRPKGAGL